MDSIYAGCFGTTNRTISPRYILLFSRYRLLLRQQYHRRREIATERKRKAKCLFFVYSGTDFMSVRRISLSFGIIPLHCSEAVGFCAEHLLIYRISSRTNPIIRKQLLNKSVQGSAKQEAAPYKTVYNSAGKYPKNIQTCVWEHDVGCSSHLTPTKNRMGAIPFKTAWPFDKGL